MNELSSYHAEVKSILESLTVDGVSVPCFFTFYEGDLPTYVTWNQLFNRSQLNGDNQVLGWWEYFEFGVFSKSDYWPIVDALAQLLKANGWQYCPVESGADNYDFETKFFFKTLVFKKPFNFVKGVIENG